MRCDKPEAGREAAMQRDAALPGDVRPPSAWDGSMRRVLLTGATGFLGRHVLRELLERGLEVHCLVRASDDAEARARMGIALDQGCVADTLRERAFAVRGDTASPRLGLGEAYERLSTHVDAVFHCAAEVSWVKSYALLRRTNVMAALEVARFACAGRTKAVTFVSSLAVCFVDDGLRPVDEGTDLLPFVATMPLGYARSKCVAETLLHEASRRGLPVTIVRPGLLAGDTREGRSNPGDVLSALVEGCVARGIALDIDWRVDSVPVDYCARAVAAVGLSRREGWEVVHLRHTRPRHWRELVLWLNLFGYPVKLIPTPRWNEQMFAQGKGGVLSSYRRFFMGTAGMRPPFEAYISAAQAQVDCTRSQRRLAALGLDEPAFDTPLLRRYVDHFARIGALPPHAWGHTPAEPMSPDAGLRDAVAEALEVPGDTTWERLPFDASGGILNEIASIRLGAQVGMSRFRIARGTGPALEIVVKAKARDTVLQDLLAEVADGCDAALGRAVREHPQALGLRRSHLREAALYLCAPAQMASRMPRCYGVSEDTANGRWSVAMEHLTDARFRDGAAWTAGDIDAAVEAAARIHSAWYGHVQPLLASPWAAPEVTAADAGRMSPLWQRLAEFAAPVFDAWTQGPIARRQRECIAGIGPWWSELAAMPRTLVHNDFNARNIALGGARRVTVLDWELARVGVPQHDLAELLCFTLPAAAGTGEVERWLALHRARLAALTGRAIDPVRWRRGFSLSLRHLLVERLPLYAVIHRYKPQAFLPAVVRNWERLAEIVPALEDAAQAA